MQREFTASVYIFKDDKVLLLFHKKLKTWLPPGGHVDENETPPEAAKREAFEETGLEVELVSQENLWVNNWNAKSIERPYCCLLQEIPAFGDRIAHQHIDFVYVGKPIAGRELLNTSESDGLRWFTIEEINLLSLDAEIFREVKESIKNIFNSQVSV